MKERLKAPELRFPGFTDDWEERKFSDFTKLSQGLQIAISDRFTEAGPNKEFYITNEFLNPNNTKKYYIENPSKNVIANKNDILMTRTGNTGKVVTNTKGAFHNNFFKIDYDPQKISKLFLYFLLTSIPIQKEILIRAGTSTIPDLNHKDFYNIKVYLPIFEEQQRIGSFFKQLDDTIALHQRKLDLLKEQKKGYLQKMFPKNGEKVPELRFAGFADDWEQRKLNEVSDIYDGTHQTPKYQDNGVMFLSVENIKTLTSNKFISREAFEDEFKIRPQRGDVLMTRIGDIGTANVVETDEDLAYYVSLALFKSEELNPYFLQASIYAPFVQDQIWKRTLHIAFPKKINKNEIGQVPINVPTLAEQTKIGSFFKQLDDTIALHQRKLDLLKEQKKGFLQKMFV